MTDTGSSRVSLSEVGRSQYRATFELDRVAVSSSPPPERP
jgi:hypothetical protein